jgi:site-specific DNA-methyltransferase (adenine-specific)
MIELLNIDCMEYMKTLEDNAFELAIVDPPYGVNILSQFKSAGYLETKSMFKQTKGIVNNDWDSAIPDKSYFDELFRVSKNQIIWGGNYFIDHLHSTKCMISWDKMNGTNNMADFELAWASFDKGCRRFSMHHFSGGYGKKIHICQKPVKLYKWLLKNYAKEGDRILDTHLGSGSIAIACDEMGFDLVGMEIDKDYYDGAVKRLTEHQDQYKMVI